MVVYIICVVKISTVWRAHVRNGPAGSQARRMDKPLRLVAWLLNVAITIALWMSFPLDLSNKKTPDVECREEFDKQGKHVTCD